MSVELMYERLLDNQQRLVRDLRQSQEAGFRQLQEANRAETKRLGDRLQAQVSIPVAVSFLCAYRRSFSKHAQKSEIEIEVRSTKSS